MTGARERLWERGSIFEIEVGEAGSQVDIAVRGRTKGSAATWVLVAHGSGVGHVDVDILKNLARGDAENALIRFDEIVSLAAAVRAAERVRETEGGVELLGFDQKTCAVCLPLDRFHGADPSAAELRKFCGTARELAGGAGFF